MFFQSGVLQCLVPLLAPTLKTLLQKRGLSGKGAALVPALNEVSPVVWLQRAGAPMEGAGQVRARW